MAIPALRVEVNGELVTVAGADGLDTLIGTLGFSAVRDGGIDVSRLMFCIMGLATHGTNLRQLTWGNDIKLKLGDRVTFEITQVDQPSAPEKILGTPSSGELAAAKKKHKRNK